MTQYILLIQDNTESDPTLAEWGEFLEAARQSGLFKGGSAIGERITIGNAETAKPSDHIGGYMRFDAEDRQEILDLLQRHPVVMHGGSVELCEMPRS